MRTAKGDTYYTLLDFEVMAGSQYVMPHLESSTMLVRIKLPNYTSDITPEYIAKAIPWISERIQAEKKPAATLEKQLQRIAIHRQQLADAYLALFECYTTAITPQVSQSPIDKTRASMLASMNDKMLRQFASSVITTSDNYVLPDERQWLIDATVAAMKEGDK